MAGPTFGTYSFLDVLCSVVTLNGTIAIDSMGVSDEGIKIAQVGERNRMTQGAGGGGMHSMKASSAARITISLLKAAPGNAVLEAEFNFESASSANWGQLFLSLANPVWGDSIIAQYGAFVKEADLVYAADGNMNEWEFDFLACGRMLGNNFQPRNLLNG